MGRITGLRNPQRLPVEQYGPDGNGMRILDSELSYNCQDLNRPLVSRGCWLQARSLEPPPAYPAVLRHPPRGGTTGQILGNVKAGVSHRNIYCFEH